MKLIIGLGNPGVQYQFTRHNIGFLVLDAFASEFNITVNFRGFQSVWGKGWIGDTLIMLAKPQTYMNLSGTAVKQLVEYFKLDIGDIIVIHDDIDLPFNTIRLKAGGGSGGHKGLTSIIEHLGGADFMRVRLGIGKPADKELIESYVLQRFTEEEANFLSDIIARACDAVTTIITSGIQQAMNKYHSGMEPS